MFGRVTIMLGIGAHSNFFDICFFVNSGNINQSLMVLRNCIEILRENQKLSANKVRVFLGSIT